MDDLVQFLRDQLDKDAARAVQWHDLECEIHGHLDSGLIAAVATARMVDEVPGAVCDCGGPARVLREIDAKRRILECHEPWAAGNGDIICGRCGREYIDSRPGGHFPCQTLRLLALPYVDRPGYREGWRP